MLRTLIPLLSTCLVLTAAAAHPEVGSGERRVAYGVMMDGADPFFGEAMCRLGQDCQLADRSDPKLRLTIAASRAGDQYGRLRADCGSFACVIDPEFAQIDLRQTGKRLNFRLSEGRTAGHDAVIYYRKSIGQIVLKF